MPSLAHEGNPKEDQIAISAGNVLSTAQLDIQLSSLFRRFLGQNIPFPDVNAVIQSSSCPNTFTTIEDGRPLIPFFYNDGQSSGAITIFTDAQPDNAPFDNTNPKWLALTIESKPQCCGCVYVPVYMIDIPTMSFTTDQVFPVHDITVSCNVLSTTGTPYAGIACFIEDGSTFDNFTGYVLASNFELSVTYLMVYKHQSLCSEGRILATLAAVPPADGLLVLGVNTDPNAASAGDTIWALSANVKDAAGANLATANVQTHDSVMDVQYTATGRGNIFDSEKTVKTIVNFVGYDKQGKPIQSYRYDKIRTASNELASPSQVVTGHRHNRANVGMVALGNHPIGTDTNTFIGGNNQIFIGGTMVIGADTDEFGIKATCDSYSFGTGTQA